MARDCCPDNSLPLNHPCCLGNCLQLENQELKTRIFTVWALRGWPRQHLGLSWASVFTGAFCKDAVRGQEGECGINKEWEVIYCSGFTARRGEERADLIPGQGLQIPREDADGGGGAPAALLCPADVWHFTKWYKMSNSFPSVKISVLGRAVFYKVQQRQGRRIASRWAWPVTVLSYSSGL